MNNKVRFVALFYTCSTGSVILGVKKVLERKKPQKNFLLLGCGPGHMDWVWGVSVLQNRPGSSLGIIPSCVDKPDKRKQDFYSTWIC